MRRHLVIGDTQVRKGDPVVHFEWIAKAINDYKPDVVVHMGDHWDMPSLSAYDGPGSLKAEGARYVDDIEAGNAAFRLLNSLIKHKCRRVLLRGNHEHRINRAVNRDARLAGALGMNHAVASGWEIIDYRGASPGHVVIDGIRYAHYFAHPNTGKPIGGTITNRLAKIGQSFVQGHEQGLQQGRVQYATGVTRSGIVCGSCYLHDEDYKGYANAHFRGIVVLNEVQDGEFCEMPLSLEYLCRRYEKTNLRRFLRKRYRNAALRFSLAA